MKICRCKNFAIICMVLYAGASNAGIAQIVGFIPSSEIMAKIPEVRQIEEKVQSIVEEWKQELASFQKQIDDLDFEIKKNRLVWSDEERVAKENEMQKLKEKREAYAKTKFLPGGEYDAVVKQLLMPLEEKIYNAVQSISTENSNDIIIDQKE